MTEDVPARRVPIRLIAILFVAIFALLAVAYALFLRPAYVPVFSNLRPADASSVVAQLDTKGIAYRLSDGGTTIAVPSDEADQVKLAVAGSDVALKGGVGFELFNKSDMGLTDFAQRINYQRALQGELERTIMMMDEIETARVHLAMPERALFRSERSPAKAAVELIAKPGRQPDGERVAGIQRLVAFAVPDLAPADVVVLDDDGRVLSQSSADNAYLSPEAEEQQGVQRYYRARARAALESAFPGLNIDVKVLVLGKNEASSLRDAAAPSTTATGREDTQKPLRNFHLRIIIATASPLNAEQSTTAKTLVAHAIGLDEAAGDELTFEIGASQNQRSMNIASPSINANRPDNTPSAASTINEAGWKYWIISIAVLLLAAFLLIQRRAGSGVRLSADERAAMINRLQHALADPESLHAR